MRNAPHVIPYQGSKRKLANDILSHLGDFSVDRVYEPFAGSAAITLAAAANGIGSSYVIGDKYPVLIELWDLIVNEPDRVAREYSEIWNGQLNSNNEYYFTIRDDFNKDFDPVKFLYLIARCVKNAIRFNSNGDFNQSNDKRRLGTRPDKMRKSILEASLLLKGKVELFSGDFINCVESATSNDLVYMDPPWQGASTKRDTRYAHILELDKLIEGMEELNRRKVPFILSFDGVCGDKTYGKDLPVELGLKKIDLKAGRSSQATLLGREDHTVESLYLSANLIEKSNMRLAI